MAPLDLASPAAIATALRRSRRPSERGDSHDFSYEYRAPNGRRFEAREFDGGEFFLSEYRPTGRVGSGGVFRESETVAAALADPNGFLAAMRAAGVDEEGLVRSGSGLGVGSIYHPGVAEVAEAIAAAVRDNAWYDSVDRAKLADPAFQAGLRREEAAAGRRWRQEQRRAHQRAVAEGDGLFKGLHNMFGPLPKERRDAILSYLNAPSEAGWDEISRTCVKGLTTLWQAWTEIDPAAPRSKGMDGAWPSLPDPETLRAAIRAVAGLSEHEKPEGEAEVVALGR